MSKFENPYVRARQQNIQAMKEIIRDEQPIRQSKLMGLMGIYGLREKTILSYLKVLQDSGFVEYNGKEETWKIKGDTKQ